MKKFNKVILLVSAILLGGKVACSDIQKLNDLLELRKTNLKQKIEFYLAYLANANLSDANLIGAQLAHANLSNADLSNANLLCVNLYRANLTDANLTDADLAYSNLTDANLTGANLNRANLSDANLTGAKNFSSAKIDNNTDLAGVTGLNFEDKCHAHQYSAQNIPWTLVEKFKTCPAKLASTKVAE